MGYPIRTRQCPSYYGLLSRTWTSLRRGRSPRPTPPRAVSHFATIDILTVTVLLYAALKRAFVSAGGGGSKIDGAPSKAAWKQPAACAEMVQRNHANSPASCKP